MNVVFDTNVYISALVFPGGVCDQIFRLAHSGKFDLHVSPDILSELKEVLMRKFKFTEGESEDIIDRVLAVAKLTYPRFRASQIEHPDADNRILECARESGADYLVTGDKKHILPLKVFGETRIVEPGTFFNLALITDY